MAEVPRTVEGLQLPPGYRLDLTHDPDAPHLRREDGWPILVFGPAASREAIERLAWADHRARQRSCAVPLVAGEDL